jgi:hypothetical protein
MAELEGWADIHDHDDEMIIVGRPIPRLAMAEPLAGRTARISWQEGGVEDVDLAPAIMSHRAFIALRSDDALFAQMRVGERGDCIVWPDGAELSAVWIEELATQTLSNLEFRDAMSELQLSLDGMAARLGIARRLVADYRKDKIIPQVVVLATRYLLERHRG